MIECVLIVVSLLCLILFYALSVESKSKDRMKRMLDELTDENIKLVEALSRKK